MSYNRQPSRTLWLDDREPRPDAVLDPSSAQFHLWLAQAQRDHGAISDRDMAKMEVVAAPMAKRSRLLWNPFTGEFRTAEIANRYKSGDYLRLNEED